MYRDCTGDDRLETAHIIAFLTFFLLHVLDLRKLWRSHGFHTRVSTSDKNLLQLSLRLRVGRQDSIWQFEMSGFSGVVLQDWRRCAEGKYLGADASSSGKTDET